MPVNPITSEDQLVLERLMHDQQVRHWLAEQQPRSRLSAFLADKDTWRLLLTAIAIPLLGWLALQGYSWADEIVHRDAHLTAKAQADAFRAQTETRSDVEQVAALMPYLSGSDAQREFSLPALKAMAEASTGSKNQFSRRMFDSLMTQANSGRKSAIAEVRKGSLKTIELLSPSAPPVQSAAPGSPQGGAAPATLSKPAVPPSLAYIQVYGVDQRGQAQILADAFRAAGVPVPGIEDVVATHPETAFRFPQRKVAAVRYYQLEDEGAARFAAALVTKALGGASPELRYLNISSQRKGLVEVWLPCTLKPCV